jgi:hypothetical protein
LRNVSNLQFNGRANFCSNHLSVEKPKKNLSKGNRIQN